MNPLDYVAPATRAKRRAQKDADAFEAKVKPGHTYYSIVDNNAKYPGAPTQLLMEWKFSGRGRWIGQAPRCGHMTAASAWLGYGPLHEHKPGGLLTIGEWSRHSIAGPKIEIRKGDLTPAGV